MLASLVNLIMRKKHPVTFLCRLQRKTLVQNLKVHAIVNYLAFRYLKLKMRRNTEAPVPTRDKIMNVVERAGWMVTIALVATPS